MTWVFVPIIFLSRSSKINEELLKYNIMSNLKLDIDILISIAAEAGNRIMEIYRSADLVVVKKEDNSPLTLVVKFLAAKTKFSIQNG